MIYIAENLKQFRRNLELTQEDVAMAIGVSPQSVSKWERGDTMPDITLLPALANFFDTSVDALVGMDKINHAETRKKIFRTAHDYMKAGDYKAAAGVYEEALKTYANDMEFMSELALALSFDTDAEQLQRAVNLSRKVLHGKAPAKVQHTTRAALCFIYLKLGNVDDAVGTAQNLPHARESREEIVLESGLLGNQWTADNCGLLL